MRDRYVLSCLIAIPMAVLAAAAILGAMFGWQGVLVGLLFSGIAAVCSVSLIRFPFGPEENSRLADIYDLGRAFTLKGVSIEGTRESLILPDGRFFSIMIYKSREPGSSATYSISWTTMGLLVTFAPMTTGFGAFVTVMISLYALVAVKREFAGIVRPELEAGLPTYTMPRDDIAQLLRLSLAEASRVASDVRLARHSSYEDALAVSIFFIGVTGGLVEYLVFSTLLGGYGPMALALALFLTSFLILLAVLLSRRILMPKVRQAEFWFMRLEKARAREEAGISADGESATALLMEASAELPQWLKARDKGHVESSAAMWMLALFIALPAGWMLFYGLQALLIAPGGQAFGFLALGAGFALLVVAYVVYRGLLVRERRKSGQIRREWEARQQYLRERLEEIVREM